MSKRKPITDLPGEEWRPIPDWPYAVSNMGRVMRTQTGRGTFANRILRPIMSPQGYWTINLWRDGVNEKTYIHRLLCMAFLGAPPDDSYTVAHGDGVRTNNHLPNLRWATRADNCADKIRHGTHQFGETIFASKLSRGKVAAIRRLLSRGFSQSSIAEKYDVTQSCISDVATGKTWAWLD